MKKLIHTVIAMLFALGLNAQVNLDSLLVAHWRLNGDATDVSGNGNHGTVMGPVSAPDVPGNADGAYSFDGMDDRIDTPTLWASSPDAITFSTWFLTDDSIPEGKMIYHGDNGEFQLYVTNDAIVCGVHLSDNWYWASWAGIQFGMWHFVAVRWTAGDELSLYLDGAAMDTTLVPTGLLLDVGSSYPASLGSYASTIGYYYTGRMDDVRIYARALSVEELDLLYAEPFTAIDDRTERIALFQNWPNPTNGSTTIAFHIQRDQPITLRLIDPLGAAVYVHENMRYSAGRHEVQFDASTLPAGTYLWELRSGPTVRSRSMIVH